MLIPKEMWKIHTILVKDDCVTGMNTEAQQSSDRIYQYFSFGVVTDDNRMGG